MHHQNGLTLWELLCALSIAAVALTGGIPAFRSFLLDARLTADVNGWVLAVQLARSDSHGQFPWGPQQPPPATPVNPQWPANGPATDPTQPPQGGGLQIPLPSASTLFLFLTALSNVWMLWREFAQRAGVKLLLDEPTYQRLKEILAKFGLELPAPKN